MQIRNIVFSLTLSAVAFSSCNIYAITSQHSTKNQTIVKILGINDFHGQIIAGNAYNNRPVGGAAVLAAYLRDASKGMEKNTVITMSGDQVGASVPASGLL